MIFVGIDPGINATGVVAIDGEARGGKVVHQEIVMGIKPTKQKRFDPVRVESMASAVLEAVVRAEDFGNGLLVVAIEEPFVGASASGALKQYSVFVTIALDVRNGWDDILIVAPTTLKKFVGAKGKKNLMARQVYKKWGYEADDDNLTDAYAIARWAEHEYNNAPKV